MHKKSKLDRMLAEPIAVGLFVLVCASALRAQTRPSDLTTVCAVAKEPDRFDGHSITVRAHVQSDGLHGSQIYDESCGQYGLLLFMHPEAKGQDELDAALGWCHRSTRGKDILGTFTGIFRYKPTYLGDPPRRSISVSRIDDLVLKSTKMVSASFPTPCPDAPSVDSLVHQPIMGNRPN
jgi:hypothetical protein